MKPLATNQRVLMWLNVCPVEESTSKRERDLYAAFSVGVFIVPLTVLAGSVLFFVQYWSIDLGQAFFAFFQIDVMIGFIYMAASVYALREKVTAIFKNLAEICNARNDSFQFSLYHMIILLLVVSNRMSIFNFLLTYSLKIKPEFGHFIASFVKIFY